MFNHVKIDDLPESVRPAFLRLKEIAQTLALPSIYDFISDPEHARSVNEHYGTPDLRDEPATIRDFIKAANYDRGRINEPQYQARLREAGEDKNRFNLTTMQYAYRAKLLNTVLQYHQKLSDLDTLLSEAADLIAVVTDNLDQVAADSKDNLVAGCVGIATLTREAKLNLSVCLKYLDGVQGLPWYSTFEAMQEIFKDQALLDPTFGARGYDFHFIALTFAEGEDRELKEAVLAVQTAWWGSNHAMFRVRGTKAKLNRKQYQSRLDNASVRGETELFDHLVEEQKLKEAEFFQAIIELRHWQNVLMAAAETLEPILRTAFKRVSKSVQSFDFTGMQEAKPGELGNSNPDAIALHIAMNNCVSARKWLVEALDKHRLNTQVDDEVPPGFDPEEFLAEMTA